MWLSLVPVFQKTLGDMELNPSKWTPKMGTWAPLGTIFCQRGSFLLSSYTIRSLHRGMLSPASHQPPAKPFQRAGGPVLQTWHALSFFIFFLIGIFRATEPSHGRELKNLWKSGKTQHILKETHVWIILRNTWSALTRILSPLCH